MLSTDCPLTINFNSVYGPDMENLKTVTDIINTLGGNAAVARHLGVTPSATSEMKRTGRIHVEHWKSLIDLAEQKDYPLTGDDLIDMHSTEVALA